MFETEVKKPKVTWRDAGEMNIWLQAFSLFTQKTNVTNLKDALEIADDFLEECRSRTPTGLVPVPSNAIQMPQKP